MKKLLVAFFALFCFVLHAESLTEGKDFITLKNPINVPKNSIVEIFNVGCPHCASMYGILPNLFAVLSNDVMFFPYHVVTGAPFSAQASEVLAAALILDKEKNFSPKDSKSHFKRTLEAYFDANFISKKRFSSKEEFIAYGLEAMQIQQDIFAKTLENKDTQDLLKEWENAAEYARIQGVPSFIINGKYLILSQSLKSEEDFIYKVDYLLSKD